MALRLALARRPQTFTNQIASYHASTPVFADKAEPIAAPAPTGGLLKRFEVTAEVTVSKLFPAGVGWQASSIVADGMGYSATDLPFFAMTGLGDAVGVLVGHTAFYTLKKYSFDDSISLSRVVADGTWLGSAAFCSGAAWQPIVNLLQGMELPFAQVFAGTWVGCGFMFLAGLRLGRVAYPFMESGNTDNLITDAALSSTIGGATGFFVGTDTAYMDGVGNFLRPIIGVEDIDTDLVGCIKAGSSTALGFGVAQSIQNIVYPKEKCWLD